jgi:hypothetical protein
MLRSDDPGRPHFFMNWLFGSDPLALASITIFNRFVEPHRNRGAELERQARLQAIDEVGSVSVGGGSIALDSVHYPSILKLMLSEDVPTLDEVAARASGVRLDDDFRNQLLSYRDGEIVFDIIGDNFADGPEVMRTVGATQRIGRLTLDRMVVSDVCDNHLTFKHRRFGEVFSGWRPGEP